MLTVADVRSFDANKVGPCYFRRLPTGYLITNDAGHYCILKEDEFRLFLQGKVGEECPAYEKLKAGGFLREWIDFQGRIREWRVKNAYLFKGPSLHHICVDCNGECSRCQNGEGDKGGSCGMSPETAKKVVERIFETASPSVTVLFQGGEPLRNWPVLQWIIENSVAKSNRLKKRLTLGMVTDFSRMDSGKLEFLLSHRVNFQTYIHGPESLHNRIVRLRGGNNFRDTVTWWKEIGRRTADSDAGIDALIVVTRDSLKRPREIVEAYLKLGARRIFLRHQNPLWLGPSAHWDEVGYAPNEFLSFYRQCFERLLQIGLKADSAPMIEQTARFFLAKILNHGTSDLADLRLVSSAGLGQLSYDFDGGIYPSDEARMLSYRGDESFRIGEAGSGDYAGLVSHPVVKTLATASCLENQPECARCAFKPYCGNSPVYNYVAQGDVFGQMPLNGRCQVKKGILDLIFEKLQDERNLEIFRQWAAPGKKVDLYYQD